MKNGKLFICPTPIGNLEDITLRTLRVLREVDLIVAEDTRHTVKLLNHYGIQKPLTSYHEHNKETKGGLLIEKLQTGQTIALVSDAGMPGISDPGAELVRQCIENNIDIEVLPGATAFITALVASGLSTDRFSFEGFLSREKNKRRKRLQVLCKEDRTLVFYESPHRLITTLQDMIEILGDRRIVLAREMTKIHEEIFRGRIGESIQYFQKHTPRGEFVILIEGISEAEKEKQDTKHWEGIPVKEHILYYMEKGLDKKTAVKQVAKDRNISKREIYEYSIDL